LLEFFFSFFSFSLFSELVTCVCCQCTHQGVDRGPKHPGTSGWSLLAVVSDWQMWCGLTLGQVLQVQIATWFALVQVKSGRERSMTCGAS
jgi:cytochrome bd-type quinol oxidase subunit 2